MPYWTTGSGRVELNLTPEQYTSGYHQGACDDDIAALRRVPSVREQLEALDPAHVRDELRAYGAWDDDELADHDANLARVLWLACGDLSDSPSDYE